MLHSAHGTSVTAVEHFRFVGPLACKERRRVEGSLLYSMAFTFGSSSNQPSTGFGANTGSGKVIFLGLRDDQAKHLVATTGFGTTPATTNTSAGTLFGAGTTNATNNTSAGTLFGTNTGNAATSTPFGTTNNTTNAAGTLFGGTATSSAGTAPGNIVQYD